MALNRSEVIAIVIATAVAVLIPSVLLTTTGPAAAPAPTSVGALALPRSEPLTAVYRRDLFAVTTDGTDQPADAPELAGIAGRIGRDAVALVRTGDDRTRSVAVGDSVDGWTLTALAPDAASFSRGGRDVRVPLPAGE